ncbi:TPM domain-containing protein [Bacillus sp. 1P06AnD]|uniref:TPM domain-containing protein n=1 Tax=Bacillus sp. 1P06AnD TaxID=3132208 RepID=UPI00399FCD82
MKKGCWKGIWISFFFFLVFVCPYTAYGSAGDAVPDIKGSVYIQDPHGYLSSSTKSEVITELQHLYDTTSAQIGYLLLDSDELHGYSLEEIAVEAFRKYGLGSEKWDNGLLVLLTKNNANPKKWGARIEVGYGLEGAIPDAKAGRYIDQYAAPSLDKGDYDQAVMDLNRALIPIIEKEYNGEGKNHENTEEISTADIIKLGVLAVVLMIVLVFVWKRVTKHMSPEEKGNLLFLIFQVIIQLISRGGNGGGRNDKGGGGSSGGGGASRNG